MSVLDALNKPITFKSSKASKSERPARPGKVLIEVGAVPRADLLPPSVVAERRLRAFVRASVMGFATVALVVVVAVGYSAFQAYQAAATLDAATAQTNDLLSSQTTYADVAGTLGAIDRLEQARAAVGSVDIAWAPYLAKIDALLPGGATVNGVMIDTASQTSSTGEPATDDRAASILYTVRTHDIGDIQSWILRLPELTGYRSASLRSVTDDKGLYSAQVEIVVGPEVYSGRFAVGNAAPDSGATNEGSQR